VVYPGNVIVVVGGGSGHEPLFLGIVGPGLADGGVAGQVFASPAPEAILAVVEEVSPLVEVVLIHGNYSGDVLDFGSGCRCCERKSDVSDVSRNARIITTKSSDHQQRGPYFDLRFYCLFPVRNTPKRQGIIQVSEAL